MKTALRKVRKSVRSKSGKTFQRSYMVKAQAPKKGRVLASFNHPGPNAGSTGSWMALLTGMKKAGTAYTAMSDGMEAFGSRHAAEIRREMGRFAAETSRASTTIRESPKNSIADATGIYERRFNADILNRRREIAGAFDVPRSHVSYHGRGGR